MRRFARGLVLGGLLFGGLLPARGDIDEAIFRKVSRDHWAYAALDRADHTGLPTGFPEGSFGGREVFTRYQLAQAVERVLCEVARSLSGLACGNTEDFLRSEAVKKAFVDRKPNAADLSRLATEFAPDLEFLGARVDRFDPILRELERPQVHQPPEPSLLQKSRPEKSADYRRGVQHAHEEWDQGRVALFDRHYTVDHWIDRDLGLPYHQDNPDADGTDASREYATGHNEEIYRLILRRGLPRNNRLRWVRRILDPSPTWSGDERRAQVGNGRRTAEVPGIPLTVRLLPAQPLGFPQLEVRNAEGGSFQVPLTELDRGAGKVQAMRGPADSKLLFLRWRIPDALVMQRYLVVDTTLGQILNQQDLPDLPATASEPAARAGPPTQP